MNKSIPNDAFKPKPTRVESKDENTSRAAKAIINDEAAQRRAKTQRLRQARLAQEAAEIASQPAKAATARSRKRSITAR
ncbi:hypothetical protein [Mesorhizobium sp. 1M-11]|uniref:hypothetical protein n=1 Tax=Mesorhizobium sp. 1M-11 TaxID=1529006 RepID=UPI0006C740E2